MGPPLLVPLLLPVPVLQLLAPLPVPVLQLLAPLPVPVLQQLLPPRQPLPNLFAMMVSSKRTEFATISMSAVTVRRITVTKIMEFVPTLPEALLALAKKVLKVMVLHVRRLLQLPPVLLPLPLLPRLPLQPLLSVMMVSSRRAVSASILTSATH